MKTWTRVVAVAAALALAPAVLQAQENDGRERGSRSVSLSTQGDATVGIWTRLSPRTDLGLNVGLALSSLEQGENELDQWNVQVEPALKLYADQRGAFLPYTYVSLIAAFGRQEQTNSIAPGVSATGKQRGAGASVGIGLDWFPASRISIGGHVGVQGIYRDVTTEFSNEQEQEGQGWSVGTFNSGIRVHLFL